MKIKKMTVMSLAVSIIFIMTVSIAMPIGSMGYVNLGDSAILLFASLLSPLSSGFVAAIGSALADIVLGYSHYAIFTLLIKGIEGACVAYLIKKMPQYLIIFSYLIGVVVMVFGYFIVDSTIAGNIVATMPAVLANLAQGSISLVMALLLRLILGKELNKRIELFE